MLVYSAVHASVTGSFGLTQAEGWFLYGRVGPIATCNGIDVEPAARGLCKRPPGAANESQSWFMFNRESPARKTFGGISAEGPDWVRAQVELIRSRTDRPFAIGFIVAFLCALFVVRTLVGFVSRHGFGVFAWYRIALGGLALALLVLLR